MRFTNEIQLPLPPDDVFMALADVERVAVCIPGVRMEGHEDDVYRGAVRIKVGPITADYAGTVTFEELNPEGRRAVMLARGDEAGGQGSAEARVESCVFEDDGGSRVVVETDLTVRGRVAQFGSGPMEKIAKRMFVEFGTNLEALMTNSDAQDPSLESSARSNDSNGARPVDRTQDDGASVDLLSVVGGSIAESLRPYVLPIAAAFAFVVGFVLGRRRT